MMESDVSSGEMSDVDQKIEHLIETAICLTAAIAIVVLLIAPTAFGAALVTALLVGCPIFKSVFLAVGAMLAMSPYMGTRIYNVLRAELMKQSAS